MSKITVGVLRGGPSSEYDVSLKSGSSVLNSLSQDRYNIHDLFIDKEGVWHKRGFPMDPEKALRSVDIAIIALHGEYGEDGTVQKLLEKFSIPYTGSNSFSSAVGMNKVLTKNKINILTPYHKTLGVTDSLHNDIVNLFRSFPMPAVIKPITGGSSVGITIARNFTEFEEGIKKAFEYSHKVLVEEYIVGREATCGVIDNFRNEDQYILLPVEIIPPQENSFFDYDAKYGGKSNEISPGNFTESEKIAIQEATKHVHNELGLRHYSRSDFIVSPKGIYFLEVNTLPGLTEESVFPKSLSAIGSSLPEFLDHVIDLALNRK